VITRHSGGDQKQIFGGIGQDHVQKAAANHRDNANQSMLDAQQAYECAIPYRSGGHDAELLKQRETA
jgi:hypothetical protein